MGEEIEMSGERHGSEAKTLADSILLIPRTHIQQSTQFENEFIAKGVEWYMICDMIIYEVCLRRIGDLGHNNSIYKRKRRSIYYIYVYL